MLFCITLSLIVTAYAQDLTFVSVVHRHGDRTPDYVYPTDPYPESIWNGLGQLTDKGIQQLYDLGRFIRGRYENFLPLEYKEEDIFVESSNVTRTIRSAVSCLNGLYGFQDPVSGPEIPVNIVSSDSDNRLAFTKSCARMDQLQKEVIQNSLTQETVDRYNEILKNLSHYAGVDINIDSVVLAFLIADTLRIESGKGLTLPDWTVNFFPEPIGEMAITFVFKLPFSTTEIKRLYCGPLLKDILMHFDDVKDGKSTLKMWEYSGHDTTVARILSCLNLFDANPPEYASTVFVELYKNSDIRYEVLVTYKSGDSVQELTIPGCAKFCPLETLKALLSDVIPDDWDAECAT